MDIGFRVAGRQGLTVYNVQFRACRSFSAMSTASIMTYYYNYSAPCENNPQP